MCLKLSCKSFKISTFRLKKCNNSCILAMKHFLRFLMKKNIISNVLCIKQIDKFVFNCTDFDMFQFFQLSN